MVVLATDLSALPIEHNKRRGAAPAPAARLTERVRREVGGVDGRGRHGPSYHATRSASGRETARRRALRCGELLNEVEPVDRN
jgi:hypothetical protein